MTDTANANANSDINNDDNAISAITDQLETCNLSDLMPNKSNGDMAKEMAKSKKQRAIEWGRPGHLTQEEVDIFVSGVDIVQCIVYMFVSIKFDLHGILTFFFHLFKLMFVLETFIPSSTFLSNTHTHTQTHYQYQYQYQYQTMQSHKHNIIQYHTKAKFRQEVNKRGGEFHNTIYSFSHAETEAYTLTRWLRARKYNLADTISMVEQATLVRSKPRQQDYYPNPQSALGCNPQIFMYQYPQLYSGFSKIGCPVFYSKPGLLEVDGVECITTLEGILKYHWHVMQHDYKRRLLEFQRDNPSFKRFECVSVLDLTGLTLSKLGSRTMDIIKQQANIDSLCFPETMNKMIIVNAPRFFTATWAVIKGFLDARTTAKVELFSSSSAAEKCLKEIIDVDQLPSDYGGLAETTTTTLAKMNELSRVETQVLYIRSSDSHKVVIHQGEEADIWIYTQGLVGAQFHIYNEDKVDLITPMTVKSDGNGGSSSPTKVCLTTGGKIAGPMTIKVKGISIGGSMFSSTENFLVVSDVTKKV